MAHEITINNGIAEMAYVGNTPWHSLGNQLIQGASIDQWRQGSGLLWKYEESAVHFKSDLEDETMLEWPDQKVLYRSDTKTPLSVVSDRYQVVQPEAVLEFFRDLVEVHGFELETAGSLRGGRRIWALARTGLDAEVVAKDNVKAYLLLATSCDGGLATTAMFTSVRVVCMNTLAMAINSTNNATARVRVRHNSVFDPTAVKGQLGLDAGQVFNDFLSKMQGFANKSVSDKLATEILETALARASGSGSVRETRGFKTVMQLFQGVGKGARLEGVAGTGWGLVNAVTEYADFHIRARNQDNRLNSAWFGEGANLKSEIVALVEEA